MYNYGVREREREREIKTGKLKGKYVIERKIKRKKE